MLCFRRKNEPRCFGVSADKDEILTPFQYLQVEKVPGTDTCLKGSVLIDEPNGKAN